MPKTNTPHEKDIDETLALSQEGYLYIKNRMDKHKSDLFQTHLFGQEVICITGKEAAEIFYDTERFTRSGAAPKRVQKTLTGENAIQGMDGEAHLHRKSLFMMLTADPHPKTLADLASEEWEAAIPRWEMAEEINLFDEAKIVLCKIACKWAGVPLLESETKEYADDFAKMIDAFGAAGPRYWKGKAARTKTEKWIENIIDNVRAGRLKVSEGSALYLVANHKALNGSLLEINMAAKELINLIRPIVAISTYIMFMALALYEHPEIENMLLNDADASHMFVQEVRRFYPFTPFVGAKVKKEFVWKRSEFKTGTLVLLDVYGINHDSRIWSNPYEFQPERFRSWQYNPFEFIPHGGGDPASGHRCPGESITVEIMKVTLDFLVNKIQYKVPAQDLSYSMARIPTLPKSGFIMSNVQLNN
jgi:fatty-acid peroxygenase